MMTSKARLFAWAKRIGPWVLGVYWVVLYTLTHIPVPSGPPGSDKVLHVAAYFNLAFLFALVLFTRGYGTRRLVLTTIVSLFAFAIFDELTQELVNRQCDALDAAADAGGVLVGLVVFVWVSRRAFPDSAARLAKPSVE